MQNKLMENLSNYIAEVEKLLRIFMDRNDDPDLFDELLQEFSLLIMNEINVASTSEKDMSITDIVSFIKDNLSNVLETVSEYNYAARDFLADHGLINDDPREGLPQMFIQVPMGRIDLVVQRPSISKKVYIVTKPVRKMSYIF